jgi:uncharacterized protein (TIGR01732 family)
VTRKEVILRSRRRFFSSDRRMTIQIVHSYIVYITRFAFTYERPSVFPKEVKSMSNYSHGSMYGGYGGYGYGYGGGYGGGCCYPSYGGGYGYGGGRTFALIVVLFILLIIVGAAFLGGGGGCC